MDARWARPTRGGETRDGSSEIRRPDPGHDAAARRMQQLRRQARAAVVPRPPEAAARTRTARWSSAPTSRSRSSPTARRWTASGASCATASRPAANDMGVTVNYSAPGAGERHAGHVRRSSTRPSPRSRRASSSRSRTPTRSARRSRRPSPPGIPVVSMNSGSDVFKDLGILAHVGQTEFQAGLGAGERFKDAGVKNAVVLQPGSRQPGADAPLQRLLHTAWAWPIPRRARS